MFSSLPFKVSVKACKPFYEPKRDKRKQRGRNRRVFSSYPCECLSKPADHFTNHKETTEEKVAGSVMFFAFTIQGILKACKPFYEPQRNNRRQSGQNGYVFCLYHPKYPLKPAGHFTNHKGKTEDNVAGRVMFFAFNIQSIPQSLKAILRTTKEEKKTK